MHTIVDYWMKTAPVLTVRKYRSSLKRWCTIGSLMILPMGITGCFIVSGSDILKDRRVVCETVCEDCGKQEVKCKFERSDQDTMQEGKVGK